MSKNENLMFLADQDGKIIFQHGEIPGYLIGEKFVGRKIDNILNEDESKICLDNNTEIPIFYEKNTFPLNNKIFHYYQVNLNRPYNESVVFDELFKNSMDALFIVEMPKKTSKRKTTKILYASDSAKEFGFNPSKNRNFMSFIERNFIKDIFNIFDEVILYKESLDKEFVWIGEHQELQSVKGKFSPLFNDEGSISSVLVIVKKLFTSKKELEKNIQNQQYFKSLFENNPDMVFSLDETFRLDKINPATLIKTGFSYEELKGKPFTFLIEENEQKEIWDLLLETKNSSYLDGNFTKRTYEATIINKFNKKIIVQLTLVPITIHNRIIGIYGIAKDITENKLYKDQITNLAFYDQLTELPNRSKFNMELSKLNYLFNHKKNNKNTEEAQIALIFFDLDNFKRVNDTLGHQAGDKLLISASSRVKEVLPKNCTLFRISGDEFTIIVRNVKSKNVLTDIAKTVLDAFSTPFYIDGEELIISSSIGVAVYPEDAKTIDDLYQYADIAMYNAKMNGKNHFSFFNKEMLEERKIDFNKTLDLKKALLNNEFQLKYQPIIDIRSKKIFAAESLIYWGNKKIGKVSTKNFISQAERNGEIHQIGEWIIETNLKRMNEWAKNGLKIIPITINISVRQLERKSFSKMFEKNIRRYCVDPEHLIVEITESVALENNKVVLSNLNFIKNLGCKLAIDDFGAGHSTLIYLKDHQFDYLKMNDIFTKNIEKDEKLRAIVKTIIELSHYLGIKVIAEGIETKNETDSLKDLGVDYLQGYLYSKPIKIDEFEEKFLKY